MASLTGQQIVDAVKDRIGDRQSGQIGNRNVDVAILDSVNRGIREIATRINIPTLNRFATIAVTTSDYIYSFPVLDTANAVIRIKNIRDIVAEEVGTLTTGWPLERLDPRTRDLRFPITNVTVVQARIRYYTIANRTVEFYPFPDQSYTATLRVNIFPSSILIGQDQPLEEELDNVLTDFATFDTFLTLEQQDMAILWRRRYEETLDFATGMFRERPSWQPDMEQEYLLERIIPGDPVNNPFVRTFNS